MPTTVALSTLRTQIRTAVRQPNASGFISDSEIDTLATEGAYELYDLLISARGADYYSKIAAYNTLPGTRDYVLPDDFYRLVSIAVTDRAGTVGAEITDPVTPPTKVEWFEPLRFNPADFARQETIQPSHPLHLRYAVTGDQNYGLGTKVDYLRFYPIPNASWCFQIVYLPTLYTGGEVPSFSTIDGWESFIVAHAAATIAAMQEDDPGFWMAKKAEQKARIMALGADRDQAQPEQVADRWAERWAIDRPWRRLPWP